MRGGPQTYKGESEMYWALVIFRFFATISAIATVLGNTSENDSDTVVLIGATVIAAVSLIMLVVSAVLLQISRRPSLHGL